LPWTPIAKDIENPFPSEGRSNPTMLAHGAIRPIHVYPFYENASHAAWGEDSQH
jgi:acetyl-CoA C-acetyltransferase